MPPRTGATLLALLLLVIPAAAPATAQSDGFTVVDVTRSGDVVRITVRANWDVTEVRINLVQGETLVGLPQQEHASWPAGERRVAEFKLLKEADRATLRFTARYQGQSSFGQLTELYIPAASDPTAGAPRLLVANAHLSGASLALEIRNVGEAPSGLVVVSAEDAQGRKLGAPYYRTVDDLARGATATVAFEVPEGTSDLVAALEYDSRVERTRVVVRGDGGTTTETVGEANVTLGTDLPFREADLGRTVDFPLSLRNEGRLALVHLAVEGLPAGYSARFFVGGSAVPSLYLDTNKTRQVTLSVTVPNDADEVDRTIDFATTALVNGTERARLPMGLAVRGVGKLEVSGGESLASLAPGGEARFTLTVRNTGTAPLFDVQLDSRRPYGWSMRYEPARLDRIDPGETRTVRVDVRAPDVIAPGHYSTEVSAKSGEVASPWATFSMSIEGDDASGGAWLWLVFGTVLAGTLGFAAWRKRQG